MDILTLNKGNVYYQLPTPIILRKVGDVCDTYDVVSGVYTKNVDSINLCGENELSNTVITSGVNGTFDLPPNTINKYSSVLKTLENDAVYLETDNIIIRNKNGSSYAPKANTNTIKKLLKIGK